MGEIDGLVFTRNREAQLDLLLRSIDRFAPDFFRSLQTCDEEGQEFEPAVRDWLRSAGQHVCFLVDDDVFYRYPFMPYALPASFRSGDYSYPFSLDGCVYYTSAALRWIDGLRFSDPNELEAQVNERLGVTPLRDRFIFHWPCVVGIPANRVSPTSGMPHMHIDVEELNARYRRGERIDLDALVAKITDGREITPHMAIPYEWTSAPARV